jgi:O-antigen/teichoic acid export membrane protein
MVSRLLRAGFIYTLANILSAGVPFFLLPILTRALSPGDYGDVISFFLLSSLSTSVAGLSLHGAVAVKWFARSSVDFPRVVATAVVTVLASTALCGAILFGLAQLFRASLQLPMHLWPPAALFAGANVIVLMRTGLWQSQGRAPPAAMLQVAAASINVGASLAGVFVLDLGAEGRILGAVSASVVSAVVAVAFLWYEGELRFVLSRDDVSGLLRFGVPLIPHALGGALLVSADRFAVSDLLGSGALGIYGIAAQIGQVMTIFADAVVKAVTPWFYGQLKTPSARGRLRVVGMTLLLFPFWLVLAVICWSTFTVVGPFVLDARYDSSIALSLWFLCGSAVAASALNIAGLFFFTSKTEWLSAATVISALLASLLSGPLVARYGIAGGGAAFVLAQALQLWLSFALSLFVFPMPWHRPFLAIRLLRRGMRR